MDQRRLGGQGLVVSALGYGAMGLHLLYGPSNERDGIAAIQRAFELGVTLFDTAELYGWGENEKVLGRAIKSFRDEVVLASKFGFTRGHGLDSRPEHIREVIDTSLRNLGVEHIDLVYQHRVDPSVPIEDVAGAVGECIVAGKVNYFGLCEVGAATLHAAHAVQPVSVIQSEYSLFAREVEQLFPVLHELEIGLVPYSPLARGFLAGVARPADEYDPADGRRSATFPWWQPENFETNVEIVRRLERIAAGKGVTLPQLALAWLLAQNDHIVPIPGTRSATRVEENVGAVSIEMTSAELTLLDAAVAHGPSGARIAGGVEWG